MEATEVEARDALIVYAVVNDGHTMESVAADWGITRERVRQIVKEQRPDYSPYQHRHAEYDARRRQHDQERLDQREEYRTSLDTSKAGLNQVFTDEDLERVMREIHAQYGNMSTKKWDELPISNEIPSVTIYVIRYGSWNAAKIAAGLPEIKPNRTYTKTFENTDCVDAVAEFLRVADARGGWFGAQHYERWRKGLADPASRPSLALLRMRMGKWNTIKQAAILRNQEQS